MSNLEQTKKKISVITLREFIFLVVSLILFMFSFQSNSFHAASDVFFKNHQRDSESLIVGRIIETKNNGYFSYEGFLGRYNQPKDKSLKDHQYELYKSNTSPNSEFIPYTSSFGFQGFFYSLSNNVVSLLDINPGGALFFHKFITSFSLAMTLSVVTVFSVRFFGGGAATSYIILVLLSQWLVVFSNNLYWMFSLIIIPFVVTLSFFMNQVNKGENNALYILIFIAIFLKSLTGYEYMSTIFISMTIPLFFYAIKDKWGLFIFTRTFMGVSISAFSAFFLAFFAHVIQLTIHYQSINKAFDVIWMFISKRTYGDPNLLDEVYRRSLESSFSEVFFKYWNGQAFDLSSISGNNLGTINFSSLITFFMITSGLGLLFINSKFPIYKRLNISILTSSWLGILAPLSWYFLAKGHSFIHGHMNHVLWYIPFLLLVFIYIGFLFELVLKHTGSIFLNKYKEK